MTALAALPAHPFTSPSDASPSASRRHPADAPPQGFVLSVDLTGVDRQDADELVRVIATLAELTQEWLPRSRARAAFTRHGSPVREVPRRLGLRERLAAVPSTPSVVVRTSDGTVRGPGGSARLTAQELALLVHLVRAGDRPVSREELLTAVWHGHDLDAGTRTVDVHVRRLRAKTGLPDLVATVWGTGYRIDPAYRVTLDD